MTLTLSTAFRPLSLGGALALGLATAMPAQAALSGYYDSAEQIAAILASNEVADALRQLPIDEIDFESSRADGSKVWQIGNDDCDLEVVLKAIQPEGPGKVTYEVAQVGRCD